jgi:uncharacterized protein DUF1524
MTKWATTHPDGNLVLISRRKNVAQGRLDYAEKKQKYFEKNVETFPNSLRVLKNTDWTPTILKTNHEYVIAKIREHVG